MLKTKENVLILRRTFAQMTGLFLGDSPHRSCHFSNGLIDIAKFQTSNISTNPSNLHLIPDILKYFSIDHPQTHRILKNKTNVFHLEKRRIFFRFARNSSSAAMASDEVLAATSPERSRIAAIAAVAPASVTSDARGHQATPLRFV